MQQTLFSLSAMLALVPVTAAAFRGEARRDTVFWLLLGVAFAGPAAWAVVQTGEGWRTGLSTTLWVTVAASLAVFALVARLSRHAWRLMPLVGPYLILLGLLATIWQQAPAQRPLSDSGVDAWVAVHIAVSVATYALVTIAALGALAAFLQERALKNKRPTRLTHRLPSVFDCELLLVRLLMVGEAVLGLGLVTGMTTQYLETGRPLTLDHKTILTITSFVVIGGLLAAHWKSGVRGRLAARLVLLGYLLLTLGYPGIKFVTDVLMA